MQRGQGPRHAAACAVQDKGRQGNGHFLKAGHPWPGLIGRDLTINPNTWQSPSAFFLRAKNYTLSVPHKLGRLKSSFSVRYIKCLVQGHTATSDWEGKRTRPFPPSPTLHPQNNCTYRDPFPQANPGSSFSSFVQAQRTWESESGHQSLSHHMIDYYFVQAPQIIRVIWLKVKELFVRNNPWTRYTLNLLTSLWPTGIHKLLVTNLQKIHSIGPRIQIKSLENKRFFENY